MHTLNEKFKNKSNVISNLEFRGLDNNFLKKNYLKKGQLKHNPSSVKEWYNSIYNLEKNNSIKTISFKNKLIYKLFDAYFNLNKLKKYNNLSMAKVFVGKPEIKHFNNKVNITLYIFDKWIMYFYNIKNEIKTTKSKQFIMFQNKLFVMTTLLLKHPKFDQKLIVYIRNYLVKMFSNNKAFIKILYTNILTFFNKTELHKLLNLEKDMNVYLKELLLNTHESNKKIKVINRSIFESSNLNEKVKSYIYIYLCIVNSFFNHIGFSKVINIFKKVSLRSSKENRTDSLKITLENLRKIYFTRLGINSLYLLIGLIGLFLKLKKILKSIYTVKWYERNIYYSIYKFNIKNILNLKNILYKLYNKKIEINIINLKYLYLDGNILALTVARKLKNRKRRVLKVIRMALRLSKKPYINKFHSSLLSISNLDNIFIKKNCYSIYDNIPLNKDLISKPISYKSRIIFYYLKHKIISGIKLQGTGRLTKRLTASRSISKSIGKGSLKNRVSSYNGLSTVMLRGYVKSNLQYVNINSYNRIGAYGIKSWISNN
jgi:hypothetical protein